MRKISLIVCFCLLCLVLPAQVTLVKDINPIPKDINYHDVLAGTNHLYVLMNGQWWETDGTEVGTRQILIADGTQPRFERGAELGNRFISFSDTPAGFTMYSWDRQTSHVETVRTFSGELPYVINHGSQLLLLIGNYTTGQSELWKTDGTSAGTSLVKTVNAFLYGTERLDNGSHVIFEAANFSNFQGELWSTDGTEGGTTLLSITDASYRSILTRMGNETFFAVNDELWKTDGTVVGTEMVKRVPGRVFGEGAVTAGNKIFFTLVNQLWSSDGTSAGTVLLGPHFVQASVELNGVMYALTLNTNGEGAFISSDGSAPGTNVLVDLGQVPAGSWYMKVLNDQILFSMPTASNGIELGISDGTAVGTTLLKDINEGLPGSRISNMFGIGDQVLFFADDGINGREIWTTDGTATGTHLVEDMATGTGDSYVGFGNSRYPFAPFGNDGHLFVARPEQEMEFWTTDGTTMGTSSIPAPATTQSAYFLGTLSGNNFFYGSSKFISVDSEDGTTKILKNFQPGSSSASYGADGDMLGDKFIFQLGLWGTTYNFGNEYWITDNTENGTHLLKDINPAPGESGVGSIGNAIFNDLFFFSGDDGTTGLEPWISDGTEVGTKLLVDVNPGATGSDVYWFVQLDDGVYFTADDGTHGIELWKTDGTPENTAMASDLVPGQGSLIPEQLTKVGNQFYFVGKEENIGWRIWKSDGTENGTFPVVTTNASTDDVSKPDKLYAAGNKLFYVAADATHGSQIFATSGTPETTFMLDLERENIWPVDVTFLLNSEGVVYISVPGETWRSAGTPQTTERILDERMESAVRQNDELIFFADSPQYGKELFSMPVPKFNQVIDFPDPGNIEVDSGPYQLSATSSSGLTIEYSTSSPNILIDGNMVTLLSPGQVAIRATQAGNGAFNPAVSQIFFCVNPPKPEITADFSDPLHLVLNSSHNGEDPGEHMWFIGPTALVGYGTPLHPNQAGTYELKINVNFCISAPSETVTINSIPQEIEFAVADQQFNVAEFTLNAAANTGNPIVYSTTSDKITISLNKATIVKPGRASIHADQPGSALYLPAPKATASFCIIPPKPFITSNSAGVTPESYLLISSASTGNQWYLNDTAITNATAQTYTTTAAGSYTVKVTIDDCPSSAASDATVFVFTGVEDTLFKGVVLYPNPAEEILVVEWLTGSTNTMAIVDQVGRTLSSTTFTDRTEISLQHLSSGIYFARLSAGGKVLLRKFVKQ
jgi:ELWxxDGT repeat protein